MKKFIVCLSFLLFSVEFSHAVEIIPPFITIRNFSVDALGDSENYTGWTLEGTEILGKNGFHEWFKKPLNRNELQPLIANYNGEYMFPLTAKPVLITANDDSSHAENYFRSLPKATPRNGTKIAYKYVFIPNIVSERCQEAPMYFYLTQDLPEGLNIETDLDSPLSLQEETKKVKTFIKIHDYYKEYRRKRCKISVRLALLELAAEGGHTEAQVCLGLKLYMGNTITQNQFEAVEWFKKAAYQGNASAQALYAVVQDQVAAAEWMKRTAEGNFAEAQYTYGVMLLGGKGVAQDQVAAAEWMKKAADQGHVEASKIWAKLLEERSRVSANSSDEPETKRQRLNQD